MRPRYAVLAALLLTYIWRYHDMAPQIQPLRLATLATLLSWGFLLVQPRARQLGRAFRLPYVALVGLWVAWMGVTVPQALVPELAWADWWEGQFRTFTLFLFVLGCVVSFGMVRATLAIHVVGAATITFFYVKGGFPLWGSPVPMYDVNDMALHLNMVLPFTLYFAMTLKDPRVRFGLWALAGFMAVSVLMTQSRGGFLTLGVILLVLWVRVKGIQWWVRLLPGVALVIGFFFLPAPVKERLSTLFTPTQDYNYSDDQGRIEIWRRGLGYLQQHPVTGVGVSNYPVAEATLSTAAQRDGQAPARVAHNSFLEVATETGIPGFILYMGIFLFAGRNLLRTRARLGRFRGNPEATELTLLADFLLLSLVAFCVGGFFLSMGYTAMLMALFATIAGFELSARDWMRQRRAAAAQAVALRAGKVVASPVRIPGGSPPIPSRTMRSLGGPTT